MDKRIIEVEKAWNYARSFTAPTVAATRYRGNLRYRIGSSVRVRIGAQQVALTCNHVVRRAFSVTCELPRIDPTVRLWESPVAPAAPVLACDPELDIAMLGVRDFPDADDRRAFYNLTLSDPITESLLQKWPGASVVIWGMFGRKTALEEHALAGLFSMPPYQAKGVLGEVTANTIVARFEEHVEVVRNVRDFPQLRNLAIRQGRSRHLGGTSGSGLWLLTEDGPLLAGILRGALRRAGDPDIGFVPIWKVRAWAEGQLGKQKP